MERSLIFRRFPFGISKSLRSASFQTHANLFGNQETDGLGKRGPPRLGKVLGNFTSNLSFADMLYTKKLLQKKNAMIIDCDGVLYHGEKLLPGVKEFVEFLDVQGLKYLFLTNSSDKSAKELVEKFARLGLTTKEEDFFTSGMATASFLKQQKSHGRALVIGTECLKEELRKESIEVVDEQLAMVSTPDFVVIGETSSDKVYNFSTIDTAVRLVRRGSRLIGTNEDLCDRVGFELVPGTGALVLPIEGASGYKAYFVGKPNPLMIRSALMKLNCNDRDQAVMIGDRMNTDIKAGVEAGVDTVLVLSGVTSEHEISNFAYRPSTILPGVGDVTAILNSDHVGSARQSDESSQSMPFISIKKQN